MDVLKNFLFSKIDFKRDIKFWFPYGKRLLANNMGMTGQADVTLCKLGAG